MKKIVALLLAVVMLLSLTACGGGDDNTTPDNTDTTANTDTGTTPPSGTGDKEDEGKAPTGGDTIVLYYGSNHYGGYEATFYCPEGAYIDEDDLEEYKADGSVMSFTVYDDVQEYQAYAENHWSREIYTSDPEVYEIAPQLYFYGELDDYNAAEYENCSQTVTDLGFQWEGKDVMLLETRYTFSGYSEQTELFVCVEFENEYWRTKDGGGTEEHLFAPALLGFELSSWNELTVDQCAWIAGQLFGVDSGRTWPLEGEGGESTQPPAADVDASALYGTWINPESDWGDTFVFNPDGTGMLVSGPQYPYTYAVSGSTLTITYEDGDKESFEVSVTGGKPILVDEFGNEIKLEPSEEEVEIHDSDALASALIGCWLDEAGGNNESFTFNADGRGIYTWKDETYEYSYTLSSSENILDISFDDGDHLTYYVEVDGNTLILDKDWELIRQ
ncbi:MAG: hypothetical protein IJ001_01540 [Oscillospiraceae bacterium]|nr:hypothetical protein [Oscillospiraceae bacterium]